MWLKIWPTVNCHENKNTALSSGGRLASSLSSFKETFKALKAEVMEESKQNTENMKGIF